MKQNWNKHIKLQTNYLEDDEFMFLVYDGILSEKGRMMRFIIKCKDLTEGEKAVIVHYNRITYGEETIF